MMAGTLFPAESPKQGGAPLVARTPAHVLIAAALCCLAAGGCVRDRRGAEPPLSSLAGIGGVEVRVFRVHDEAARLTVPEESLRVDFERRLRAEGIPVLTPEARGRTPGEPQLWVLFKAVEAGPLAGCACGTDLYVTQSVQIARYPMRTVRAITWNSRSGIGVLPELTLEAARRSFDPAWAEFVAAYRSANPGGKSTMAIQLTSTAFQDGTTIPRKFTGDSVDVSPPLEWLHVPVGTKTLALICDDPDAPAGTWVHWVLYNIPATRTSLAEGVPKEQTVEGIGVQGRNDFKRTGYGGPGPPPGKPHRYFFKLYALDTVLQLKPGAEKRELEAAMKGHILAQGQLMGLYRR
jgi:hypothetical protein